MTLHGLPGCCGLREINSLSSIHSSTPEKVFYDALISGASGWANRRWRVAIFSQANSPGYPAGHPSRYTYGEKFAQFILDNNLGTVQESPEEINPNSGNLLKTWMWTADHNAINVWQLKEQDARAAAHRQAAEEARVRALAAQEVLAARQQAPGIVVRANEGGITYRVAA